jgi:hypothetical protein
MLKYVNMKNGGLAAAAQCNNGVINHVAYGWLSVVSSFNGGAAVVKAAKWLNVAYGQQSLNHNNVSENRQ